MAKNSVRQWDPVAANNLDVAGITLAENQTLPSMVNGIERAEMAQIIQYVNEMSYPTAGGTANALTLTPTTALAALASNVAYTFNAASANTTAATLAVSGLTAKAIRKIVGGTDVALAANDIQANGRYTVVYDTAANAAAGAWILTAVSTAGTLNQLVIRVQTFTSSGTYTPNANMVYCIMEGVAGGGGGGGAATTAASGVNGAGGGGGGEYSRVVASAATIGASQTVTIGALGAGGTAGNNAGGTGGTTSVGTLLTAVGGTGGAGVPSGGASTGGTGGTGGTGSMLPGATGFGGESETSPVINSFQFGGRGGDSAWGRGSQGVPPANNGAAGTGFGAGGSGGTDFNAGSNRSGGAGTVGKVIIMEFCSA